MEVNYIYKCELCTELYKTKETLNTKSMLDMMGHILWLFPETVSSTRKYDIHDCDGDQSVYGVARLIGIEKVE